MRAGSWNSSVHTWPDLSTVHAAAARWAESTARRRADLAAIGYIGSYARGDWGPGSDLDLIVVTRGELPPLGERAREWDTADIPVPTDLILYSAGEWRRALARSPRWRRVVKEEAVWLIGGPEVEG